MRQVINTKNAPAAIGSYSQAVEAGNTVYLSGQIPLDPASMLLVEGDIRRQVDQVFENIKQVVEAAKGNMNNIVKLTVYLTDISNVTAVNEAIADYFEKPYPARTTIQVSALPKGAGVEIEALMVRV
jgi:reactive intermediate/imine deaminase